MVGNAKGKEICSHSCTEVCDWQVMSPIGTLNIATCNDGVHSLAFNDDVNDGSFCPDVSITVALISPYQKTTAPMAACLQWLATYFQSPQLLNSVATPTMCHLHHKNLAFRNKVWKHLSDNILVGETITYGQLATAVGNKGAVRAVGSAMRLNPVCLIVPCHRVVRTSGLGLYSGGKLQLMKEWLLNHERVGGIK